MNAANLLRRRYGQESRFRPEMKGFFDDKKREFGVRISESVSNVRTSAKSVFYRHTLELHCKKILSNRQKELKET
ncbi:hypothetical protein LEP1GSC068_1775 [Leptospira sp. Fiocruz LV3954]|nr:hypothetical protein LEP1GSC068_1775 [Leptospira sp. Fiocruz LV3954]EMI61482.1 hypothetical protein LEP1GSC076_0254 [Leptospira sp. Fiocruz LV4135]